MIDAKPICSQADIDDLRSGDVVEFYPDISPGSLKTCTHALCGGQNEYGYVIFYAAGRTTSDIYEHRIRRHHLLPGEFETLDIQERVTIIGPLPLTPQTHEDYPDIVSRMSLAQLLK